MHRYVFFCFLFGLLGLASCNDPPPAAQGADPAPYALCDSSDDCVVVRRQCVTAAVHKDHVDEYAETLEGVRLHCARPENGEWPSLDAECREGTCAIIRD